jgi:hypothetical protein
MAERSLYPKELLQEFPHDVNMLSLFTDYHWMFKKTPSFTCKEHYYIGDKKYDIDTPITAKMLDDGFMYLDSPIVSNSMESISVQLHMNSLKKLQNLLKK